MKIPSDLRLVFWEATAGCNLECVHCRRLDVGRALMKDDLPTKEVFRLIDGIAEVGKPIFVLSGGEPLIRPDIFEIAAHGQSRGLTVSLATNGTLVDDPTADRIAASGIKRVAISIDGTDAKTHDDFRRQPGSLAAALRGFDRLRARGLSLQINCTISRHNVHQLDDFYKMATGRGADALHFFMLVPVGCGATISPDTMLTPAEYERVLEWIYARASEHKLHVRPTCAPHYFRIRLQHGESAKPTGHGYGAVTRGCLAGSSVCFVSHTGQVFPCGYLPVSAGDVTKESFAHVWNASELFERLRQPDLLEGKCGACEYRTICLGCRARAYSADGNYMGQEPSCDYEPRRQRSPA